MYYILGMKYDDWEIPLTTNISVKNFLGALFIIQKCPSKPMLLPPPLIFRCFLRPWKQVDVEEYNTNCNCYNVIASNESAMPGYK
jgi:hypothetical protein